MRGGLVLESTVTLAPCKLSDLHKFPHLFSLVTHTTNCLSFIVRIAAVLLDTEARSVSLDADPSHGHIREPILKLTGFLRAMETKYYAPLSAAGFSTGLEKNIGQSPHKSPSVFSFFLPEYSPPGVLGNAGLISPESMVLDSRLLHLVNGLFSTVKFGLHVCGAGFGTVTFGGGACPKSEGTIATDALAELGFTATNDIDAMLDELSLLLTSSRLSSSNRAIIKANVDKFSGGNKDKSLRIAQQLIAASPEFHSTNLVKGMTGIPRQTSGYSVPPKHKYKTVVYFYMDGGADSYNLLVPKSKCNDKDMFKEYTKARQGVAIPSNQLLDIDATGSNQICNTFGVYYMFPLLQKLYAEKKAIFFANTGVLSKFTITNLCHRTSLFLANSHVHFISSCSSKHDKT